MRAGYNPVRRSRNIGQAKQGHGQNNRLVIPDICADHRIWTERLGPHVVIRRTVNGREAVFVVEDTFGGCRHHCTVDDVARVLAAVPLSDWDELDTFVLRQSTKKQRLLRPAWGRLYYSADLGLPGRKAVRFGPAVVLEAIDCDAKLEWSTSLDPDDQQELERLREDGHRVEREGRRHRILMTSESVRVTQLYRTLLHEIGHWVDWLEKVERRLDAGRENYDELRDAYFARPRDEREAYAHRYAGETRERLARFGLIPFEPIAGPPPLARPAQPLLGKAPR